MKVTDLIPDKRNANRGTDRGRDELAKSLETLGAGRSILIDKEGRIIAGNKTAEAAGKAGLEDVVIIQSDGSKIVAVQRTDLDLEEDPEARKLAFADNRVAELDLDWDIDAILSVDFDLSGLWTQAELAGLLSPGATDPSQVPTASDALDKLQAKWATERGQIWAIGRHRLMCGDSTDEADVAALLAGQRPNLMVTDPPYGVEYDPQWREQYDQFHRHTPYLWSSEKYSTGKVENDDRADWAPAWLLFPGEVAYTWSAPGDLSVVTGSALIQSGYQIRNQIIWRKQHFVFGRGAYHYEHEPCWYAVKKGGKAHWIADRKQSTVWDIPNSNPMGGSERDGKTVHGTEKPVECMARPIRNHDGDVYDPFVGSGTTMVAAEQLQRSCFALDISPGYVAVTLERMSELGLEVSLA